MGFPRCLETSFGLSHRELARSHPWICLFFAEI